MNDDRLGGSDTEPMSEAAALIGAGHLDEARAICQRVLDDDGDNADAHYAMGWIAFRGDDPEAALERFRRVIELNPGHARAHNNIATILMSAGDNSAAARHLEAAIEAAPDFIEAQANLGAIRFAEGALNEARVAFQRALELDADNPIVLLGLGQVLHYQNAPNEAEAALTKALDLMPDSVQALTILAQLKDRLGAFEDAEELLNRAISLAPSALHLHLELGDFYRIKQKRADAIKAYTSAVKLKPDSVAALSRISFYSPDETGLNLCDTIDKAIQGLRPDAAGDRVRLAFARARALDQAKRYEEAWSQAVEANQEFVARHQIDTAAKTGFSREAEAGLGNAGLNAESGQPAFVFIAGMPRAGKSSAEKLIGALPDITLGYEHNALVTIMEELNKRINQVPTESSEETAMNLSSEFQTLFRKSFPNRTGNRAAYTVTIPDLRILDHIPNILKVMPNAYFIFVDRDIWDNALKVFMYDYKVGLYDYSYRLSSILENIRLWRSAMDGWTGAEPSRCLKLNYEDMVVDPHAALGRVSKFLKLQFPSEQIDPLFDDRNCAAPYREYMQKILKAETSPSQR